MPVVRCNTCGAEYETRPRDGSHYAHVCGPAVIVQVRDALGQELERPLPQFRNLVIVPDDATRTDLVTRGVPLETIVVEIERRTEERPDRRDENTLAYETIDGARRKIIRAEGAGVTPIANGRDVTGGRGVV